MRLNRSLDPAPNGLIDGRIHAGDHLRRWAQYGDLWLVVMLVATAGAFGVCWLILKALGDIEAEFKLLLLLPFATICLSGLVASSYAAERHRRAVLKRDLAHIQSRDFLVCLHCRYDLSRTPAATACPECGQSFNPATARASWLWTYRDALPPRERKTQPWLAALESPELGDRKSRT